MRTWARLSLESTAHLTIIPLVRPAAGVALTVTPRHTEACDVRAPTWYVDSTERGGSGRAGAGSVSAGRLAAALRKNKSPDRRGSMPRRSGPMVSSSDGLRVDGLRALLALLQVELHALALAESGHAGASSAT